MSNSNVAAQGILNQCFRGVSFAAVTGNAYATLTTTPGGTEVAGTGYARILAAYGAASAAQPSVATASEIDWGTVAGDWTPLAVDTVDFYTALTAGTLLYTGTDTEVTYAAGNRAFAATGSTFSLGTNSLFSAAYAATIVDWLVNGGAAPAQLTHMGLLNSGTELSGGNYARLDVSSLWAAATLADPSVLTFTAGAATFQASATFTGTANQFGFYTASTGGSPGYLYSVTGQTIASSDEVTVDPTVTLT